MTARLQSPKSTEGPRVEDTPRESVGRFADALAAIRRRQHDLLAALLCMLVSTAAAVYSTGARPSNLGLIWGRGDATVSYAAAKSIIENGWWTPNPDLGYPFVQDGTSFPAPDFLALWAIKAIGAVTQDPFSAINIYFMLGFPLVAVSGYALLRYAGTGVWIATLLATSLALIPWHFERFAHLFLANYSFLLVGLLVVAVAMKRSLDGPWSETTTKLLVVGASLMAVCVGLGGTYAAAFITLIGGIALAGQFLAGRPIRSSLRSVAALLLVPITLGVALFVVQLSAIYKVTVPISRGAFESELYGGKFYTLFRIAPDSIASGFIPRPLRELAPYGQPGGGWEGDAFNNLVTFSAIVVTCLLVLVTLAGTSPKYTRGQSLLERVQPWLLLFVISSALFVATGVGSVIAGALSPQIRSWGRLSIVVIAIALVVLGIALTLWWKSQRGRVALTVLLIGMACVTLADPIVNPHRADVVQGESLEETLQPYVNRAEQQLAANCPVLELPISMYPEEFPIERSADSSELLPYLYSTDLRWSYGGVKTTEEGRWAKKNLEKPPAEQVALAKNAGFCALQLDMFGYPVAAEHEVRATYTKLLGNPISVSSDKRWMMFRLS